MHGLDEKISSMSMDQKVGQLFTFGFFGCVVTPEIKEVITRLHAGGLRFSPEFNRLTSYKKIDSTESGEKLQDSIPRPAPYFRPRDLADALNRLQELAVSRPAGIPLHVSTDIEGGGTNMSRGYPVFPAPMGLSCTQDPDLFRRAGAVVAKLARATGINMVHSPVLDVVDHPFSVEINIRSYGDDPERVALYAAGTAEAFHNERVIATGKHFPGRGYSDKDVHYSKDLCTSSLEEMLKGELLPYIRLIPAGLPAIMLAHSGYPGLSGNNLPATICPEIIQGILREKLGFEGVITTDSITMRGILKICSVEEACARAIKAGADLVLYKTSDVAEAEKAISFVKDWVSRGEIPESQIDMSVRRILTMKKNAGLFDDGWRAEPEELLRELDDDKHILLCKETAGKAALLMRDEKHLIPVSRDKKILVVEQSTFASNTTYDFSFHPYVFWEMMEREFHDTGLVRLGLFGVGMDLEAVKEKAGYYDIIVATNMYSREAKPNTDFLNKIIESINRDVIVVTTTPFPVTVSDAMKTVLCIFSQYPLSLQAAVDVIGGKLAPGENLPVKRVR